MNLDSVAVRKILPLLALRPGEGFTLTDLCRFSGLDTKSVTRVLAQFREDGFLLDNAYGPRTYSSNPAYPMLPEIKTIALRLLDLPAAVQAANGRVQLMIVFGSLLRPTYRADSDIDVLVVSLDTAAVKTGLGLVSQRLGKTIAPQVYDPARFSAALASNDPFIHEILERPHAILGGSLEHFGVFA